MANIYKTGGSGDRHVGPSPSSPDNLGVANTGVTVAEYGDGYTHTSVLTVDQVAALTTADGVSIADGYLLYTFPAGEIIVHSAYMSMGVTAIATQQADEPDVGLGTVIADGAVAVLGGTSTFEDIIAGLAGVADGTELVKTEITNTGTGFLIATADAHTIHYNVADAWLDVDDTEFPADIAGTVVLNWSFMG